jgi:hypothetical protein
MKYNLNINQFAIIEQGLDVDLYDAAILNFVCDWLGNSSATIVNHQGLPFTWISHKLIIKQIPMLRTRTKNGMKPMSKDTVYRRMKRLCEIGLLQSHPESKVLGMSLYRGTAKLDAIKYGAVSAPTDINPKGYGYKSVGATDTNPNYNTIKDNTIINNKEKQIFNLQGDLEKELDGPKQKETKKKKEKKVAPKKEKVQINYPSTFSSALVAAMNEFIQFRKEMKKPFRSQLSINKKIKQLQAQVEKYGEEVVIESINIAIANGWQGTFPESGLKSLNQKTNGKQTNNTNKEKTITDIFAEIDERYQQGGFDPSDIGQSAGPF